MFFGKHTTDEAIINALNASQAVIEFTPDGRVVTANANFLTAMGYRLEEIAGQHHSLFCDPAFVSNHSY
ncbi:MAG: PAS domain-containing protein, partial [Asticcacaulis sp.]